VEDDSKLVAHGYLDGIQNASTPVSQMGEDNSEGDLQLNDGTEEIVEQLENVDLEHLTQDEIKARLLANLRGRGGLGC